MSSTYLRDILHSDGQPAFLNPGLLAFNAFEIDVPDTLLEELASLAPALRAMEARHETFALDSGVRLFCDSPEGWQSDIRWLCNADAAAYRWFEGLFVRLDLAAMVAPFVPHDRVIRLYAGSFVTRSRCEATDIHMDWVTRENLAFTLMVPLTANGGELGLTYKDARGAVREYPYPLGRGLVFGTLFEHSTSVGQLDERAVFLCLNFGTDRIEHWPELAKTTGSQGDFVCLPDGRFMRREERQANGETAPSY